MKKTIIMITYMRITPNFCIYIEQINSVYLNKSYNCIMTADDQKIPNLKKRSPVARCLTQGDSKQTIQNRVQADCDHPVEGIGFVSAGRSILAAENISVTHPSTVWNTTTKGHDHMNDAQETMYSGNGVSKHLCYVRW